MTPTALFSRAYTSLINSSIAWGYRRVTNGSFLGLNTTMIRHGNAASYCFELSVGREKHCASGSLQNTIR